ncbi:MAG: thioredoxin family protein, partial [Pseudomonadota bacterium]
MLKARAFAAMPIVAKQVLSRLVFACLMAVFLIATMPAMAKEPQAYSPDALAAAQATGKPVLVDVFASWCPTCRRQHVILAGLYEEPKYKNLIVLRANFDEDKDALKALNVRSQSTLIVFKG